MSKLPKSTKRRDLVKRLGELGFEGPFLGGGKHPEFMVRGEFRPRLPNAHRGDVREPLLKNILVQAGVTEAEYLG